MAAQINIGVIGAGRIGQLHAKNLAFTISEANVTVISDVYIEAAQKCAEECSIPKAVKDHREILTDKNIEAVFICSPTETHAQLICEAAEAGKHIFCEKPIDLNPARIDDALAAVKKAGVKLQIGFNRRFDPNFRRAKEYVTSGDVGTTHLVKITSRDPQPPSVEYLKGSGGLFLDQTIHDFDMCRFILGQEVKEIYAVGSALVDRKIGEIGDIDTAVITLTYQSGAYCVIDNSRQAVYGYDQRLEVFGTKGCVVVDNRKAHSATMLTSQGIGQDPIPFFFLERYKDAYLEETREFIECIIKDKAPSVTGIDGKIPLLMGLAAQQSLKERRPVPFSL